MWASERLAMTAFLGTCKASRNKGRGPCVGFNAMGTSSKVPLLRRVLAPVSLAAAAGGFAWMGLVSGSFFTTGLLALAAVVGAGALALGRRALTPQVLGRGIAWTVLTPSLLGIAEALGHGHLPDAPSVFFGATSAAALVLARPLLHTQEARTRFAPVAYRRLFLAGAVASATAGTACSLFAFEAFRWGSYGAGVGLSALAMVLVGSAIGVVRMRAWGVLLAAVGSVSALVAAAVSSNELFGGGLALAAIPGALLLAPLLAARLGIGTGEPNAGHVGAAPKTTDEAPLVRTRIAVLDAEEPDEPTAAAGMVATPE